MPKRRQVQYDTWWPLVVVAVTVLILMVLFATSSEAQEAPCVNIPPRELQAWIGEAALAATSQCPKIPVCQCPAIPDRWVICETNNVGTILRCKRRVLLPEITR